VRFLTRDEVVAIHARVLREGPLGTPHRSVRHAGAVLAALERTRWGPFEVGDLAERAALRVFLDLNGARVGASDDEIVAFVLRVACGAPALDEIARWFRSRLEYL
jgi:prophage maintenance system killer protein